MRAGSDHPYVYHLLSGWVSRKRRIADGREQIILMFLPGELFAMKSMFVSCQPDEVSALTDAVVQRVHYRDIHRSFCTDIDVAHRCMWQIVAEERRLHTWIFALARTSAEERLAWALLDFRTRLADGNAIASNASRYTMPLTQEQLSCHLGITPVHMNRVLKRMRENGILTLQGHEVVIHRPAQLTAIALPLLDLDQQGIHESELQPAAEPRLPLDVLSRG